MSATVTDIRSAIVLGKQCSRLHTQVLVRTPFWVSAFFWNDPCIGMRGIVTDIQRIEEGQHSGKVLYTIRFETFRGYIIQVYLEEELNFQ